jgi:hypothetical protein
MTGATDTTTEPDTAPLGMVAAMVVAVHAVTVKATSLRNAKLFPCEEPNPLPEITS